MKFAQFGDTHLGYKALRHTVDGENARTRDTRIAFETVCDQIAKQMPDLDFAIHTGDLFDHAKPNFRTIAIAIKGLRKIAEEGKPVIVIAGNHDISRIKTAGNVYDVMRSALPNNVYIVSGFKIETLNLVIMTKYGPERVRFVCIPYGAVMLGDLSYEYREDDADHRILIAHGTLEGAMPEVEAMAGYDFSNIDISPMAAPGGYLHFALGHLHTKGTVGDRTLYNGSTNRFGWSDKDAVPGWWSVDTGDDYWNAINHRLVSREMIDLEPYKVDYARVVDTAERVYDIAQSIEREVSYQTENALKASTDEDGVPDFDQMPLFRVRVECNRADYRKLTRALSGLMEGKTAWTLTVERSDASDRGLPEHRKHRTEETISLKSLLESYKENMLVERYGNLEAERIGAAMLDYLERAEEGKEA